VSLPVTTTAEADTQIRTIDDWWRQNRRASPDLFLDELSSAFEILARAPQIGCIGAPPCGAHVASS